MKSHDFAKHLIMMAKVLKSGPNVELEDVDVSTLSPTASDKATVRPEDMPQALGMLVGLNNVPKQQWIDLIDEYGFDIEIRPRDANRDIYGKLLKYLSNNPVERLRLTAKKGKPVASASSELAEALTILLK
ncbi:hypothetical protein SKZ59_16605 [Janthinobacterium sp. GMG2]|uniref:hypothetical protein n=1 Tax=Janthinobacterium sp. GMG2 TaxID=3096606 RepID=UPI0029F5642A|nr:hypothetical protein [Janthinobacterium sp. GMG2]MDX8123404.1 hypothetical protein [Janthinobacterium sp. GMG2]